MPVPTFAVVWHAKENSSFFPRRHFRSIVALSAVSAIAFALTLIPAIKQKQPQTAATSSNIPECSADATVKCAEAEKTLTTRSREAVTNAYSGFTSAVTLDKGCGRAYVGLAQCAIVKADYGDRPPHESYKSAREDAQRAIDLGATEGHIFLAAVKMFADWNFDEAGRDLEKVKDKVSGSQEFWRYLALHQLVSGRFSQAQYAVAQQARLDRDENGAAIGSAYIAYYAGRYTLALQQCNKAIDKVVRNPNQWRGYLWRGRVRAMMGDSAGALHDFKIAYSLEKKRMITYMALAYGHACNSDRTEALHMLKTAAYEWEYINRVATARVYVALKDYDKALSELQVAKEERQSDFVFVRVDPALAPLRERRRTEFARLASVIPSSTTTAKPNPPNGG